MAPPTILDLERRHKFMILRVYLRRDLARTLKLQELIVGSEASPTGGLAHENSQF
jgi:hypothetical protein